MSTTTKIFTTGLLMFAIGGIAVAERILSVAFVLRNQNSAIDLRKFQSSVESALSFRLAEPLVEEEGSIIFNHDSTTYAVAIMPVGVPESEIKDALENSLLIKDKVGLEKRQKAHIVVTVSSQELDKIQNSLALTRLVTAVLRSTDSLGVYWGSAAQVIQPGIFLSFAENIDEENLPIPIWIGFTVGRGDKGETNLFSTGMKELGYAEYEVIDLKMKWEDCYYFLLEFTSYMITSKDSIPEGDTIGRDESEKFKVRYPKSELTDDARVMRIYM